MLGAGVHDLLDEHVRSAIDDAEVDVATAFANRQVAKQLDYGLQRRGLTLLVGDTGRLHPWKTGTSLNRCGSGETASALQISVVKRLSYKHFACTSLSSHLMVDSSAALRLA